MTISLCVRSLGGFVQPAPRHLNFIRTNIKFPTYSPLNSGEFRSQSGHRRPWFYHPPTMQPHHRVGPSARLFKGQIFIYLCEFWRAALGHWRSISTCHGGYQGDTTYYGRWGTAGWLTRRGIRHWLLDNSTEVGCTGCPPGTPRLAPLVETGAARHVTAHLVHTSAPRWSWVHFATRYGVDRDSKFSRQEAFGTLVSVGGGYN